MVRTALQQGLPQKRVPPKHKDAIGIGMPFPAAPHDFLERQRSIVNARRKFALIAVRFRALLQQTWDLTKPCNSNKNWTFTVSDKRNTASAFAFVIATATTRLAYRAFPTTPCS